NRSRQLFMIEIGVVASSGWLVRDHNDEDVLTGLSPDRRSVPLIRLLEPGTKRGSRARLRHPDHDLIARQLDGLPGVRQLVVFEREWLGREQLQRLDERVSSISWSVRY